MTDRFSAKTARFVVRDREKGKLRGVCLIQDLDSNFVKETLVLLLGSTINFARVSSENIQIRRLVHAAGRVYIYIYMVVLAYVDYYCSTTMESHKGKTDAQLCTICQDLKEQTTPQYCT